MKQRHSGAAAGLPYSRCICCASSSAVPSGAALEAAQTLADNVPFVSSLIMVAAREAKFNFECGRDTVERIRSTDSFDGFAHEKKPAASGRLTLELEDSLGWCGYGNRANGWCGAPFALFPAAEIPRAAAKRLAVKWTRGQKEADPSLVVPVGARQCAVCTQAPPAPPPAASIF